MKTDEALILGIGGQDGLFLSLLLAEKGFKITGILLPSDMSAETLGHLPHESVRLVQGSICDERLIREIVREVKPAQIYNLAGISFIPHSWESPQEVANTNGFAVAQLLSIIKQEHPKARFFQAGSSEIFGHTPASFPQNENTPFSPDNPYGSSKVFAIHLVRNFRSQFGLFACTGILYNHESQWRGRQFVTRKITLAAASARLGKDSSIRLGNINALRDWSYAGDVVEGMWLMMAANEPKDYVIASGSLHSVRDILDIAFEHVDLSWKDFVEFDESLNRPLESVSLCGDPVAIKNELDWKPRMSFEDMIRMMVEADMKLIGE
jgi:GDPmannose 4,6-dehydratase